MMNGNDSFKNFSTNRAEMLLLLLLQRKLMRARSDPNEFLELCFREPAGKSLRQSHFHRELQAFLSSHRRALIELPRDHGKSVQVCARILWELGREPGLRVKIFCATEAIASQRGRFIREAIEKNPLVSQLFPQLQPSRPWTDTEFTVQRPANTMGPSVASLGIGSGATGTRADLLVCDDIVDVRSMLSRNERERIKNHFRNNLVNLLDPQGRFWGLFTPWHRDDLNAELKLNPEYRLFRRAISEELTPIWPERWPREKLQERLAEIGSTAFARAYRLQPTSEEEILIRPEWVRFWSEATRDQRVILSVDPAVSEHARADASALVVLSLTSENRVHCREAIARRVTAPLLLQLIDELDRLWSPEAILFESNAAFKGIADLLIRHTRFGAKIKEIAQSREKAARVHAFAVSVENGTFRLKGKPNQVDPSQRTLFDEMTLFPATEHDDLLDAAMTGMAYLLDSREVRVWV
jgi:predicted phage terminase large subunit-like protein